jgi:CheY-like chemotaxis protein
MQEILFVHDFQESPITRKNYLEMSGFQVTLLKSGDDCLKRLGQQKPALVLMDILLEGKNGFESCRAIREIVTPEDLPIVLCTHIYRSRAYRDEALAVGAQRYLLLPMKMEELLRNVTELTASASERVRTR